MSDSRTLNILIFCIAILAIIASSSGIISHKDGGIRNYQSIRGENVEIHGKGVYRHMSAEVAPQGIAQDYITLLIAVPLLLIGAYHTRKGSLKCRFVLAGTLGYLLVTYLLYLNMGMYNELFLVYAALLGLTFFSFFLVITGFDLSTIKKEFNDETPHRFAGGFLIFVSISIGLMWLGIIIPPLLDGSIYPKALEHYTTLVVQGIDLGLLLPISFVSGFLFIKKSSWGYLFAPVYLVFLSILMTALSAKITGMGILGFNIVPAVYIIPIFNIVSVVTTFKVLKSLSKNDTAKNISKGIMMLY